MFFALFESLRFLFVWLSQRQGRIESQNVSQLLSQILHGGQLQSSFGEKQRCSHRSGILSA